MCPVCKATDVRFPPKVSVKIEIQYAALHILCPNVIGQLLVWLFWRQRAQIFNFIARHLTFRNKRIGIAQALLKK